MQSESLGFHKKKGGSCYAPSLSVFNPQPGEGAMLEETKAREIVEALTNGDAVEIEAESQADAQELHAEIVQRLYQVNHLWTEAEVDGKSYTAKTSAGGQLTVTVKPTPSKASRRKAEAASTEE